MNLNTVILSLILRQVNNIPGAGTAVKLPDLQDRFLKGKKNSQEQIGHSGGQNTTSHAHADDLNFYSTPHRHIIGWCAGQHGPLFWLPKTGYGTVPNGQLVFEMQRRIAAAQPWNQPEAGQYIMSSLDCAERICRKTGNVTPEHLDNRPEFVVIQYIIKY